MKDPADQPLVEILRTRDLALLAVVKSVLESSGIRFEIQGEQSLNLLPLNPGSGFFRPAAFGASIRVRSNDAAAACELLSPTVPGGAIEEPEELP
ncbi:MAG: hypothetical protein R3190_06055 [Thermoanaerobaculia bacterium]|nr:hypothetical protein [Thermoanaerobaculia bacterium]